MRRPPHGGTTRPGPARPGNGYGRPLRVIPSTGDRASVDAGFWLERELEFELADAGSNERGHHDVADTMSQARTHRVTTREPRRAPDLA